MWKFFCSSEKLLEALKVMDSWSLKRWKGLKLQKKALSSLQKNLFFFKLDFAFIRAKMSQELHGVPWLPKQWAWVDFCLTKELFIIIDCFVCWPDKSPLVNQLTQWGLISNLKVKLYTFLCRFVSLQIGFCLKFLYIVESIFYKLIRNTARNSLWILFDIIGCIMFPQN